MPPLFVHRRAVAGDINAVTAAAHIQLAVLIHHRVITRDFSSSRTPWPSAGIATVVGRRIITRNCGFRCRHQGSLLSPSLLTMALSPFISVPVESLPSTVVLPLLFTVASSPLTWCRCRRC
ncbi:hypothetical protein DMI65_24880 [Escherichia coli]|nr:hypothetical protein [Escherichia coli]